VSSIRFDSHVENSTKNVKWIHEPHDKFRPPNTPNKTVVIMTPSDHDFEPIEPDSDAEEVLGEPLPSNEADDILLMEEMELLDDAEDGDTDTSAMGYTGDNLSLNWELPVRNSALHVTFHSHRFLGYLPGHPFCGIPSFTGSSSHYWSKICTPKVRVQLVQ